MSASQIYNRKNPFILGVPVFRLVSKKLSVESLEIVALKKEVLFLLFKKINKHRIGSKAFFILKKKMK